jgi:glyoxylase-like metal-dependent hydrolase (beta-lactamase superfamily II)
VFDGGIDERGDALDVLLGALGARRDDVSDVFLTHGHFDHVTLAPLCKKARIHLGIADADMAAHKVRHEPWGARWFSKLYPTPDVALTNALLDRAEIDVGGEKLLALPLPGHTAGSYLFVFRGILFAGDSITRDGNNLGFAMRGFSQSVADNKKNLAKLKEALGTTKVEQICTGHQGCTPREDTGRQLDDLVKKASP